MTRIAKSVMTLVLFVVVALAFGCGRVEYTQRNDSGDLIDLKIGDKNVHAELALDDATRSDGLMYRTELAENTGMLFGYEKAKKLSFWMKNTVVPLSIAFVSEAGEILQIEHMRPHDERRTLSKMDVRFALEMSQGWFERNGIVVGSRIDDFEQVIKTLPIQQERVPVR